MKYLLCEFGIFRASFAIFKWFIAFSLCFMQVIKMWTIGTQIIVEKYLLWSSPHVYPICKKNQKGDMQKDCVEPPQKWTFSFSIMKMKNKSETVQFWHGAMILIHNVVVKIWDGF